MILYVRNPNNHQKLLRFFTTQIWMNNVNNATAQVAQVILSVLLLNLDLLLLHVSKGDVWLPQPDGRHRNHLSPLSRRWSMTKKSMSSITAYVITNYTNEPLCALYVETLPKHFLLKPDVLYLNKDVMCLHN